MKSMVSVLVLLACADPCVAVMPLIVAAAPLGAGAVAGIAVVYEVATISTMTVLVLAARRGAMAVRARWVDRFGDVAAGAVIAVLPVVLAYFVAQKQFTEAIARSGIKG
jgi:ABC-type maltose transport system permease subunit